MTNSPVPMPKPPTASASSAHPEEAVPRSAPDKVVVLCVSVINGWVGCGAGMASALQASSREFQLKPRPVTRPVTLLATISRASSTAAPTLNERQL
jgi:hypothetical protein